MHSVFLWWFGMVLMKIVARITKVYIGRQAVNRKEREMRSSDNRTASMQPKNLELPVELAQVHVRAVKVQDTGSPGRRRVHDMLA